MSTTNHPRRATAPHCRTTFAEHRPLPADLQAIKDRLSSTPRYQPSTQRTSR